MTAETPKELIARILKSVGEGDLDILDDFTTPEFSYNDPGNPTVRTREEYKNFLAGLRAAFPDLRTIVDEMIAEGDRVVIRWVLHGTHSGEWRGQPATGRTMDLPGISVYHVWGGKVAKAFVIADLLGLARQLRPGK